MGASMQAMEQVKTLNFDFGKLSEINKQKCIIRKLIPKVDMKRSEVLNQQLINLVIYSNN